MNKWIILLLKVLESGEGVTKSTKIHNIEIKTDANCKEKKKRKEFIVFVFNFNSLCNVLNRYRRINRNGDFGCHNFNIFT